MSTRKRILIIGGYGHVGSLIVRQLLKQDLVLVRIGGRSAHKAASLASTLGCESTRIDPTDSTTWDIALEGVDGVLVCVDQKSAHFVSHILSLGKLYIDITAEDDMLRQIEALASVATTHGGRAVLSVGMAPGLTNLLVKEAVDGLDTVDTARIGVLLGLGDSHGPAAIDWTLREFTRLGRSSTKADAMDFGTPPRRHPVVPFGFADQHVVRRTLGVRHTTSLLTFDSPFLSRMLFPLLRVWSNQPAFKKLVKWAMGAIRLGTDRAALAVEVTGSIGQDTVIRRATLEGHKEADITALVAASVAEHCLTTNIRPGVWHIEQLMTIADFSEKLKKANVTIEVPADGRDDGGERST